MVLRSLFGLVVIFLLAPASIQAQTPAEYQDLEKMVVKVFEAYNKDDAKGVFADYFSAFKGQDPALLYKALFEPHKATYGKYKSHKFVKEGSAKTDEIAAMVLIAQFEKKKGKVSINFGKEDGKFKIQQVLIGDE